MTTFVVVGAKRTGTTFLRRSLDSHPDIVCHGEAFAPGKPTGFSRPVVASELPNQKERDADPVAFLDKIMSFHKEGCAGFKLLIGQSLAIRNEVARRGYRHIVLRRENELARFSSWQIFERMLAAGRSILAPCNQGVDAIKAHFDADVYHRFIDNERRNQAAFDAVRATYQPLTIEVTYDGIVWGDQISKVQRFLNVGVTKLDAGIDKMNCTDVVSRFDNPKVVEKYLYHEGLQRWSIEGPPSLTTECADARRRASTSPRWPQV